MSKLQESRINGAEKAAVEFSASGPAADLSAPSTEMAAQTNSRAINRVVSHHLKPKSLHEFPREISLRFQPKRDLQLFKDELDELDKMVRDHSVT